MSPRLRYALLFAVAAVPLVGVGSIKPIPLVAAACVFVAHGILSVVTRARERLIPRDVVSALLLVGCFEISAMFLVTSFAMAVAPAVTPDGHPVMAIGQAFVGIVGGGAIGMVLAFAALRSAWRDRRLERLLLHVVGVVVVVAAVVKCVREWE